MKSSKVELLMKWVSGELTFAEYIAALDAAYPLTCRRDSTGSFVRDERGAIVVVASVPTSEGSRSRQRGSRKTQPKLAA